MTFGEASMLMLVSALLNAGATWGVVSTKLQWLRRDVDRLEGLIQRVQRERAVGRAARGLDDEESGVGGY